MVRVRADLHTHSSLSDGTDSPTELVRLSEEIGLGGVALTDHDTLDGLREFLDTDVSTDIIRVPGVELSTEYEGKEAHVLGYFVPLESQSFLKKLKHLSDARVVRLPKFLAKLQELGVEISQEELDVALEGVKSPGRPHLAQLLVQKGFVKSTGEAFDYYLSKESPAYVPKEKMQTLDAIKFLKSGGAIPVLAHPLTVKVDDLRSFLQTLVDAGLRGIEIEYDYSPMGIVNDLEKVRDAARGFDLIHTGGSDYHGDKWMGSLGNPTVSLDIIEELQNAADTQA
ncbi:MAG: PHP domain-containing protein [Candidatus Hodarchaeota archaeon]